MGINAPAEIARISEMSEAEVLAELGNMVNVLGPSAEQAWRVGALGARLAVGDVVELRTALEQLVRAVDRTSASTWVEISPALRAARSILTPTYSQT